MSLIHANALDAPSEMAPMKLVIDGLILSMISVAPPTRVAFRLPHAPSMVDVDVAASLATSVIPRSMMAWLNSSAVIWPSAMASRKFPV